LDTPIEKQPVPSPRAFSDACRSISSEFMVFHDR
jgi:hypothetical protein